MRMTFVAMHCWKLRLVCMDLINVHVYITLIKILNAKDTAQERPFNVTSCKVCLCVASKRHVNAAAPAATGSALCYIQQNNLRYVPLRVCVGWTIRRSLQKNAFFILHVTSGLRMALRWSVESGLFLPQLQTLIYELLVQWCSTAIKLSGTIRGVREVGLNGLDDVEGR